MVDIKDKEKLERLLAQLDASQSPAFGQLSAQHVVEHLASSFALSNGTTPQTDIVTPTPYLDKMIAFLKSDKEIREGFRSPLLAGEDPPPLHYGDLKEALSALNNALNDYEAFFEANPQAQFIHPSFGMLDKTLWDAFHNKHFTHHLVRQYKLVW